MGSPTTGAFERGTSSLSRAKNGPVIRHISETLQDMRYLTIIHPQEVIIIIIIIIIHEFHHDASLEQNFRAATGFPLVTKLVALNDTES